MAYQHSHDHGHSHAHGHHHHGGEGKKAMVAAFVLNVVFTIIELVGSLVTQSTAILSDAIHDLGDSVALGLGLWLERRSGGGRTKAFTFGQKRFSLLSGLILSVILIGGSCVVIVKAAIELFNPHEVDGQGMFWLAVLGIVFNGIAFWRMQRGGDKQHRHNTKAITLHFLEDVLGWVAVLLGGAAIWYTGWTWIDPALSIAIAAFVLTRAVPNFLEVIRLFLQAAPPGIHLDEITQDIRSLDHVKDVHDVHLWSMDGDYHVLSLHVVVEEGAIAESDHIRREIERIILDHDVQHPTIQVESEKVPCVLEDC